MRENRKHTWINWGGGQWTYLIVSDGGEKFVLHLSQTEHRQCFECTEFFLSLLFIMSNPSLANINLHDCGKAFSPHIFFYWFNSCLSPFLFPSTSHFSAKKASWALHLKATSCKKRHVYVYVCSYVEAQLFFLLLPLLLLLPLQFSAKRGGKKNFFFQPSRRFFQIIKKQFYIQHFTHFIQHHMAWQKLYTITERCGVRREADTWCLLLHVFDVAVEATEKWMLKKKVVHVWVEYEIGLCCSWNVNMKNYSRTIRKRTT